MLQSGNLIRGVYLNYVNYKTCCQRHARRLSVNQYPEFSVKRSVLKQHRNQPSRQSQILSSAQVTRVGCTRLQMMSVPHPSPVVHSYRLYICVVWEGPQVIRHGMEDLILKCSLCFLIYVQLSVESECKLLAEPTRPSFRTPCRQQCTPDFAPGTNGNLSLSSINTTPAKQTLHSRNRAPSQPRAYLHEREQKISLYLSPCARPAAMGRGSVSGTTLSLHLNRMVRWVTGAGDRSPKLPVLQLLMMMLILTKLEEMTFSALEPGSALSVCPLLPTRASAAASSSHPMSSSRSWAPQPEAAAAPTDTCTGGAILNIGCRAEGNQMQGQHRALVIP
ncbi:hypothetical protein KIL84_014131 [Mauremys mutica]|uniref:Uncharacterized protein n=1 Tax=Mauremys mutica TaxID=74926 RepID=A0A9D3XQS4_9SAUR|nr:hypothetical protein KIL84_014131 [Mauremys mutica]